MACECCNNALEHKVRYILEYERHAPRGQEMSRAVMLQEIAEALDEFECDEEARRDRQKLLRDASAQWRTG